MEWCNLRALFLDPAQCVLCTVHFYKDYTSFFLHIFFQFWWPLKCIYSFAKDKWFWINIRLAGFSSEWNWLDLDWIRVSNFDGRVMELLVWKIQQSHDDMKTGKLELIMSNVLVKYEKMTYKRWVNTYVLLLCVYLKVVLSRTFR